MEKVKKLVIMGAGPAGLAAAYELVKSKGQFEITILDKNDRVGGLARTVSYKGCLFDVGPHRFYTKNEEVLKLWKEVLGRDFIRVKRLTRMLYRDKLFLYPVSLMDVVAKLSKKDLIEVLISFIGAKLTFKKSKIVTFEDYITYNFGRKLFNTFFKTYTEKVWGIPCNKIDAKWAKQRIKNLNFWEVFKNSLTDNPSGKEAKSLVSEFYYPKKGAGLMYETMAKNLEKTGVRIILNSEVTEIHHQKAKITKVSYQKNGKKNSISCDFLLSSMPLTNFVLALAPGPKEEITKSAHKIYFRDHITVNLVVKGKQPFPDNWIYVHDPSVQMARVTNFKSISPAMSKNKDLTPISVEYFSFKNDDLWKKGDPDLVDLAIRELVKVKLINSDDVTGGFVIREMNSYPVYYTGHQKYFEILKKFARSFSNLELIGRGGMFKYDNMDHAIFSGMLAARNILEGTKKYDTWGVNEDAEYQEEK